MGRVRAGFKWGVFFSSYVPLFLILAAKHYAFSMRLPAILFIPEGTTVPALSIFWLFLSILSLISLYLVISVRRSKEPEPKPVKGVDNKNDAITSYILVYIFPFVVLDLSQMINWISFLVFFIVIGIIQVRSNNLYVNPILGIVGYDIYEVETTEGTLTVLTSEELTNQTEAIAAIEISNGVFITKPKIAQQQR